MNTKKAQNIGAKLAVKSMVIGLIIAQSIMTLLASSDGFLKGFLWFLHDDFFINIIIAIVISLIVSYYIGRLAGKHILINKKNHILIGIGSGLLILFLSSFLSSWVGFFQEGIDNIGTNDNPFFDYIFKPVYWVSLFGLIPVLIVGTVYGIQINKHKEIENPADNML